MDGRETTFAAWGHAAVGIGAVLSRSLDRTGAFDALLRLRGSVGATTLPVLCYHRVNRLPEDYPFDAEVVDATPEQFEGHLQLLRRYYTLIGVDELAAELGAGRKPKGAALVTFDDGYRDNCSTALPILRAHGVPATFFLATSYITERRVYWWDRVSYLFARTTRKQATLTYPTQLEFELEHQRGLAKRMVLTLIKTVYGLDLQRLLDALALALEVEWNEELERRFADELILSWDDVREMQRQGMHFGSHSRTHRILSTLPQAELKHELVSSKREIETVLGTRIDALSYPVGMSLKLAKPILEAVTAAGYKVGFTNISGVTSLENLDPYDISRVALDRDVSDSALRGMLAFPPLCTVIRPWTSS